RSPSSAPPPRRRVGSTARTAIRSLSSWSLRNRRTSSSVSDDLPEPPVPVMPSTGTLLASAACAIPVCHSAGSTFCCSRVIVRDSVRTSPARRSSNAPASFSARSTSHSRIMWLIIPGRPSSSPSSGEKMRATPRECSRSISSWTMTPPPPPNTFTWPAPRSASSSTRYVKYSTCPPWYALIATPWASSAIAAVTTSSTERLCPRWITSAPCDCRMRRMMLMEASCPSNRLAAVTNRTGCTGRCSSVVMPPKYLDFLLIQRRPSRATTGFARDDRLSRGRGRRATGRHGRPSADRPRVVHAPDREPLLHRVLDHGDQRLLRRLAFPGVAAHERDALVDGQRLTHVVQVVLQ